MDLLDDEGAAVTRHLKGYMWCRNINDHNKRLWHYMGKAQLDSPAFEGAWALLASECQQNWTLCSQEAGYNLIVARMQRCIWQQDNVNADAGFWAGTTRFPGAKFLAGRPTLASVLS